MAELILSSMAGWHAALLLLALCLLVVGGGEALLLIRFNRYMKRGEYPAPRGFHPMRGHSLRRIRRYGRAWFAEREHPIVGVLAAIVALWGFASSACSNDPMDFSRSGSLITMLGLITASVGTLHARGLFEAHSAVDPSGAELSRLEHNYRADGLSKRWIAGMVVFGTLIWGYGDLLYGDVNAWVCDAGQKWTHLRCITVSRSVLPSPSQAAIEPKTFRLFFNWNSANLRPDGKKILRNAVDYAKRHVKWTLHVTGHADSSGSAGYNMELSARRANSVKLALIAEGVPEQRIVTTFEGDAVPLVNEPAGTREAKNRCVEIVIY